MGPTSQAPLGRALRACGALRALLAPSPSSVDVFWSKKNHRKSFISFGLRLVFLFCKLKNKEKTETGTGLYFNRLVPKIIENSILMHIKHPK